MQLNPPSTGLASAILFTSATAWGLYWVPLRYLETRGLDGSWAIAALNAPASVVLLVVVLLHLGRYRGQWGRTLAIGLCTGAAMALYAAGLVHSSVVRATLLFYLTPVWATLIGIFWLGERAGLTRWAAIVAGLVGLGALVSGGGSVPLNIGDAYALASGMFWAMGAAMIVRYDTVPVPGMTMLLFAVTSLIALALGAVIHDAPVPDWSAITGAAPVAVPVSILAFLPAVCIIFWAQKFVFPGRGGLLMMSEVMTAVISASLFLPEEQMSLIQWGGAALIIGACLVEVLGTSASDSAPRAA